MSDIFPDAKEGHQEGDQPVHYYYNREERIAHAPQNVKDYYAGKMNPVRGFRVLFQKQNRYILLALVIFVAFTWMYTGFNKTRNYAKIDNIAIEMQTFSYDGEVYTNIKVKPVKNSTQKKPVKVEGQVYFVNIDNQPVEMQEVSLIYSGEEQYLRTKFSDYDIIRVDAIVTVGEVSKELSSSVSR